MGDYPVSTESLWFDKEGEYFRLKNIPFFIDYVSYDDLIELKLIRDNVYEVGKVISPSGNSTIWICSTNNADTSIVESFKNFGCAIEGGVLKGYYTVNVPSNVDFNKVCNFIEEEEAAGVLVADYPCTRHGQLHQL